MVDFFIHRPVFATVCALLIILAGAVVIPSLPISLYPQLGAVVLVATGYIGADSGPGECAIPVPLEEAINGVPGMRYIQSTSGNDGSSIITTTFNTGYDLDIAAVDVQNRVSSATGLLPAEVNQAGITVSKAATNFVFGAGAACGPEQVGNYLGRELPAAASREVLRALSAAKTDFARPSRGSAI